MTPSNALPTPKNGGFQRLSNAMPTCFQRPSNGVCHAPPYTPYGVGSAFWALPRRKNGRTSTDVFDIAEITMRKRKHALVERAEYIDVRELRKAGAFPRQGRTWHPFCGLTTARFRAEYRGHRWPRERRTQIIPIVWTRCFLGGYRPWFTCPCGRRAARLFSAVLGFYRCRVCSGVVYESQSQSPKRRIYRKAKTIREAMLGDKRGRPGIDPLPERPYRMHRKTFNRQIAALRRLESQLTSGRPYRPKSPRQWGG